MPKMNIEVDKETDNEIMKYQLEKKLNEDSKVSKAKVAAELIKKGLEAIKKEQEEQGD